MGILVRVAGHTKWVASLRAGDEVDVVRYHRGAPPEFLRRRSVRRVMFDRIYLEGETTSVRRRAIKGSSAGTFRRGSEFIVPPDGSREAGPAPRRYSTRVRICADLDTRVPISELRLHLEELLRLVLPAGVEFEVKRSMCRVSSRDRRRKP